MKTNEILDGNKIIAEFMGGKKDSLSSEWFYFLTLGQYIKTSELNYDLRWEQIMPVVEKIDNIGASVIIGRMFCEIKYIDTFDALKSFDIRIASGVKINAIYGAIIEFIKWYNANYKIATE